ncbi:MAG: hypothetical protein U0K53_00595 [Paludibacteraceae bacterium]|nr:hypothetical protein [Paludibacteraceae bacterium]
MGACTPPEPDGPDGPDGPEEDKKTKYIIESAEWLTYSYNSDSESWLNKVSKTISERGEEAKYLESISYYLDEVLQEKVEVTTDGMTDHYKRVYPTTRELNSITWYDDARTKEKEVKGDNYQNTYTYDIQDRLISRKYSFQDGEHQSESTEEHSYSGLTRYSIYISNKGTDYEVTTYDTTTYVDNTFSQVKESRSTPKNAAGKIVSKNYSKCEYGPYGVIKQEHQSEAYNYGGEPYETAYDITINTWSDDLNMTWSREVYRNGILEAKLEGYNKYTY